MASNFWSAKVGFGRVGSGGKLESRSSDSEARALQPADQELPLVDHFLGQVAVKPNEQLLVLNHFAVPLVAIEGLQLFEAIFRKMQTAPFKTLVAGHSSNRPFLSLGTTPGAIDNPFQNLHVLAETRPDELTLCILAKPIYVKDARRHGEHALHFEPMPKVVAHVVATERKHGHGVAAYLTLGAFGRGGHLGAHGRAHVNAGTPIECLKDQRHGAGATAAKNDGADGDSLGILP